MRKVCRLIWIALLPFHLALYAQESLNIQYGKISPADLEIKAPSFDPSANAIVVADVGISSIEGSNQYFGILYTRFVRVKILNKNGYEAGTYHLSLVDDGSSDGQRLYSVKGTTYNMENGVLQKTELDPKTVFTEQSSRSRVAKKFSLPALKEGSVFDLEYTIKSNYFQDPPTWYFQGDYPCLWSEYRTTIPPMFHYLLKKRGDDNYDIQTTKPVSQNLFLRRAGMSINCESTEFRWVKKNVPVLKDLPYISTLNNYRSALYFELSYFQYKDNEKEFFTKTWPEVKDELIKDEDFGYEFEYPNPWMDGELKDVVAGSMNPEEEIRRVYDFVRDNFECDDDRALYKSGKFKDIYKKRTGNVADINLLLVAFLKHRNVDAFPIILSTKENGIATPSVPLLYEYNYTICGVKSQGKTYLLDASGKFNSFNRLPTYCYNGVAQMITSKGYDLVELYSDSVIESKTTNIILINDEKGNYSGSVSQTFGPEHSSEIRKKVRSESEKDYFKKQFAGEAEISEGHFDSLSKSDIPLVEHFDVEFTSFQEKDILYVKPLFGFDFPSNPFEEANRVYPVEMPYKMDYLYIVSMEIPKGFQIDEVPKSARVKLNESDGMFEYLIQQGADGIQIRVRIKMNKAFFVNEDYNTLRDFFAFVVSKSNEQIVFRKTK